MKIGFTCSTFDLLHAGHVIMLREAKQQCDFLICGLQVDPSLDRKDKNPPVQTLVERYSQLHACKYVDEIVEYTTEQELDCLLKKRYKKGYKGTCPLPQGFPIPFRYDYSILRKGYKGKRAFPSFFTN